MEYRKFNGSSVIIPTIMALYRWYNYSLMGEGAEVR